MPKTKTYWFPAKRYGWGWGLPAVWQGWAVIAAFGLLIVAGALTILPRHGQALFTAYSLVLCLALVGVCWMTGESPRWRWGKDD